MKKERAFDDKEFGFRKGKGVRDVGKFFTTNRNSFQLP